MGPVAISDGHDAPGGFGEAVPGAAADVEYGVIAVEDAVREIIVAQELPDILHRVQFR